MALFTAVGLAGTLGVASSSFIAIGAAAGLNTLVGIGLNKLAIKLSGRDSGEAGFGVKGQLQRGADIPQSFLFGKAATAGSLSYVNTWAGDGETPNAFLTMVISLSDLPIQALDAVWVNGERGTIAPIPHVTFGHPIEEFHKDGSDHVWVHFLDGTQTTANDMLVNSVSTTERPWEATAVASGTAYVVVTVKVNQELFSGFPNFLFECTGLKLYDPSRDDTVGGFGPHRWEDSSTWGGDGDHLPAVQLYNLLRGLRHGSDWLYGMQVTTAAQLPAAHWIAQINKCRAEIASVGGNEPTYRSGGEISVGAPLTDAVEALLDAMQGRLSEAGGVYKPFVGAPDAAVASFSDGDILSTEEQRFTPFFGLSDTVNGISAKYPDPDQGWQIETAPPLNRSDFEVEDGARRLMVDAEFNLVPYPEQVQRLMLSALNEARRARRHTFTLPPRFWTLEPGDIISWTSDRNGYVAKLFRVDGVMDQPNANVVVDLTEIDPSDYNFDTNSDYTPITAGSTGGADVPAQAIAGWAVSATSVPNGDGTAILPAIKVQWTGIIPDVVGVRVQVRRAVTEDIVFDGSLLDVASGQGVISGPILASTDYEVRGKYVPGTPRETEWTSWVAVSTLNLGLGSGANDIPKRPTDLVAIGYFQSVKLTWDEVTQNTDNTTIEDLLKYKIYRNSTNNPSTATLIGASTGEAYTDAGLADNTTYHYWVTAVDVAGNESTASDGAAATTNFITAQQMVDTFRDDIGAQRSITRFTSLPSVSGYEIGEYVVVNKMLYRKNESSQWEAIVGDIEVNSITGAMVQANTLSGTNIAGDNLAALFANLGEVTAGSINTLNSGVGLQANVTGKENAIYVFQNSRFTYSSYFENFYDATNDTSGGGAVYVKSRDGYTLQVLQTQNNAGNRAADIQNSANGGHAAIGVTISDGAYGVEVLAGGFQDSSGVGYGPFTGVHDGMLKKRARVRPGDILCDRRVVISDLNDSFTEVELATRKNCNAVVGVYAGRRSGWGGISAFIDKEATAAERRKVVKKIKSAKKIRKKDRPDGSQMTVSAQRILKLDPTEFESGFWPVTFNSVGEGGVNVCGRNGNLAAGDLVVPSDLPGKGQRQDDHIFRSETVAKVRGVVTFDHPDEVKLVACTYHCG